MTNDNFQKWRVYTAGLASPDNFVNWGFRYVIAAALQRRVWIPSGETKLFPNIYPVLVGPAGVGKGNVIRYVNAILSHHKLKDFKGNAGPTPIETEAMGFAVQMEKEKAAERDNAGKLDDDPLLIPIASDAVTYEALIQTMARSRRSINFVEYSEKHGRDMMRIESHSSLAFCLEEMSSLLRKNTESTVNFLLQAYDCGEKYEYRTKHAGVDRVLRLCLNFLAGTTPEFMQEVFDDRLMSQGFSSRAFFIYASKNRKHQFFIPKLTTEQEVSREDIKKHVLELTKLYGQIQLAPETVIWLEEWWKDYSEHPEKRASRSAKMDAYYARKNIHVMKVAMATHFGESTSLEIPQARFEEAMQTLHEEEKTMHLALSFTGTNPLAKMSQKVLDLLRSGMKEFNFLLIETFSLGGQRELNEVLEYLRSTNQVELIESKDPDTNKPKNYWKARE